jgi:hypothetical protein
VPESQNTERFIAFHRGVLHPLHVYVQHVNASTGAMIEITIIVKGIAISGYLISIKDCHDGMSKTNI